MTLAEAVKSGKPFRHKGWASDTWANVNERGVVIFHSGGECWLTVDAISDDWMIQQKETFTRADVERAVDVALSSRKWNPLHIKEEAMKAADSGDEK